MSTLPRHFVIATAGHVDHGKSALVQALTGTDPDRLPEEKRRGMTIDLGFAQFALPNPGGPALQISLVDVPGHEDLVKNMIAGVGAVDAALLVIAADDGPMPQTLEHLQVLTYLGIRRGVIALTKSDLLSDPGDAARQVRRFIQGSSLAAAPIVPVSARTGDGISQLRSALLEVLAGSPVAADAGKPRLAIDRAFSVRGAGTVVTGTLSGGSFSLGQTVVILPSGTASRIRGIQTHNQQAEQARPGSRVALNLTDVVPADNARTVATVGRGDWVATSTAPPPALVIDAVVYTLSHPGSGTPSTLRDGLTVKLHLGTAAVTARLQWDSAARRFARCRLSRPVLAMVGDRFVLRSASDQRTLAGGIVLDAGPQVRRRLSFLHDSAQHAFLEERSKDPLDVDTAIRSSLDRDRVVDRRVLFATMPIEENQLVEHCERLHAAGILEPAGPFLVRSGDWNAARSSLRDNVVAYHQSHPQQHGLPLSDARRCVQNSFQLPRNSDRIDPMVEAMTQALVADRIVRSGTVLRQASHQPTLPPRLQAPGNAILTALRKRPFDPPSTKELVRNDADHQALKYLVATGQVIDLGQHAVLAADAFADAVEQIRHQLRITGSATVSEFKTALASSRRIMVPLLERLDRDRVTRRQGDLRFLA